MAYIVNQDVIDRVGNTKAVELTSDSGSVVDAARVTEARESAEGEANGYLSRRYDVPVDTAVHAEVGRALVGKILDLAVYNLMTLRPPVAESYRQARDDAIAFVDKIAKGEILLPGATTPASTNADDPVGTYGSEKPNLSTMTEHLT